MQLIQNKSKKGVYNPKKLWYNSSIIRKEEFLKMSNPLLLARFKQFVISLNLSQEELVTRYNAMNRMYIEEKQNRNDKKVLKFLQDRKQFLADEAMKIIVRKELA
jgi:hypothetical protein